MSLSLGPGKAWNNNQIEPISAYPLSGSDCISKSFQVFQLREPTVAKIAPGYQNLPRYSGRLLGTPAERQVSGGEYLDAVSKATPLGYPTHLKKKLFEKLDFAWDFIY